MFNEIFESIIEQDFAIAYLKLLGKMRYNKITVTMLVETAGYGRATFYSYYSGLRDLRQKLNECDKIFFKDFCEKALAMTDTAERRAYINNILLPHIKVFWPLCHENNTPQHMTELKILLSKVFNDSFRKRFKDSEFDADIIKNFCVGGSLQLIVYHFVNFDDIKYAELLEKMVDFSDYLLFEADVNWCMKKKEE